MRQRLEQQGGMNPSEVGDALSQFKAASARFIAASSPEAAAEYLEVFLGLFGKEGSVHLLLELTALMPSRAHALVFSKALCAKWGLSSLPIIDPPQAASDSSSSAAAASSQAVPPPPPQPPPPPSFPPLPPKVAIASGPTYGASSAGSAPRRVPLPSSNRPAANAMAKREAKPPPRVTLAYAATRQPAAPAPAPAPAVPTGSGGTSAASGAAAAAAAAAAAQFAEEESWGATAALRAAMQYSGQPSGRTRR